jgi:hypothetical protein
MAAERSPVEPLRLVKCLESMRNRLSLLVPVLAAAAAVLPAGAASGGGWAVATLDAFAAPSPGETVEIGFVARRHGVTPEDFPGSSIEIVAADGQKQQFAAEPDGVTGHHSAEVVFPSSGTYTWSVNMGGIYLQDLGTIEVPGGGVSAPGGYQWPLVVRIGLPALAGALIALAAFEVVAARRRRLVPA